AGPRADANKNEAVYRLVRLSTGLGGIAINPIEGSDRIRLSSRPEYCALAEFKPSPRRVAAHFSVPSPRPFLSSRDPSARRLGSKSPTLNDQSTGKCHRWRRE